MMDRAGTFFICCFFLFISSALCYGGQGVLRDQIAIIEASLFPQILIPMNVVRVGVLVVLRFC